MSIPFRGAAAFLTLAMSASTLPVLAVPIFEQTPTITTALETGGPNLTRLADNFSLAAPATARSVTWRGSFIPNTPSFPVTFSLGILENDPQDNLPGLAVGVATATFNSISDFTDTGLNTPTSNLDIYEFSADLPDLELAASTTYWLTLRTNMPTGQFFWGAATGGDGSAFQTNNQNFRPNNAGLFYFTLDDQPIPEPAAAALLALSTLLTRRQSRPCSAR